MNKDGKTEFSDQTIKEINPEAHSLISSYLAFMEALGYNPADAIRIAFEGKAADTLNEYQQRMEKGEKLPGLETFFPRNEEDVDINT